MSCEMCTDPDGIPCFPQYGPAPHIHVPHETGAFMIKRDVPKEQWAGVPGRPGMAGIRNPLLPALRRRQAMTHIPKGRMCAACTHRNRDCSTLPFDQYPVIGRYSCNGKPVAIVKCAEFERK